MITIFTDGSVRGNPGRGGWGAVIAYGKNNGSGMKNNEWVTELGGEEGHTTNNRMELTAAIKALEYLDSSFVIHDSVVLHTDSEYVKRGMTEWIEGWQKKGWKTASKKPVENQDLWKKLLNASADKEVGWKYVAGHSGHPANERCDEIATGFSGGFYVKLYTGSRGKYKIKLQ